MANSSPEAQLDLSLNLSSASLLAQEEPWILIDQFYTKLSERWQSEFVTLTEWTVEDFLKDEVISQLSNVPYLLRELEKHGLLIWKEADEKVCTGYALTLYGLKAVQEIRKVKEEND